MNWQERILDTLQSSRVLQITELKNLWKYTIRRYSNLLIVDERLTKQEDYYRLVKNVFLGQTFL